VGQRAAAAPSSAAGSDYAYHGRVPEPRVVEAEAAAAAEDAAAAAAAVEGSKAAGAAARGAAAAGQYTRGGGTPRLAQEKARALKLAREHRRRLLQQQQQDQPAQPKQPRQPPPLRRGSAAKESRRNLLSHKQENALFDSEDYERYDKNSIVGVTSLHFDGRGLHSSTSQLNLSRF